MALLLLLGLAAVFAMRTLVGWRKGVALMIVLAAVQDPLRKLVPGTPGWLVLITAPVFFSMVVVSMVRTRHWWGEFRRHFPSIARLIPLLVIGALPSAVISATYGAGSWMLTLLGAFSYSLILLAILAGYHYARSVADVRHVLAVYCGVHGLVLSGAFLEHFHLAESPLLGSAALGYEWIRWGYGYTVDMVAGFYRSADVMGWHAAAVSMLCVVLGMTARGKKRRLWLLASVVALAALLLCGRRKMVFMLPVFAVALGWIYWQAGRSARVVALLGLLAIPIVSVWLVGDVLSEQSANLRYYTGEGVNESVLSRIEVHGFGSLATTYRQSGFFGSGLGIATPGAHNLNVERPRAWQESTGSRILVELGVPGALAFLAVMVAVMLAFWREAMRLLRARLPHGNYAAGLLAFFLANVGSLTVSGQILADPFIASFLGLLVGMSLSLSRLPESRRRAKDPAGGEADSGAQVAFVR
jgi:hypothetical protein